MGTVLRTTMPAVRTTGEERHPIEDPNMGGVFRGMATVLRTTMPASLVVPAVIIHHVVHMTERAVKTTSLPSRVKPVVPVVAALLAIIPVVPAVDAAAEMLMEPTLGAYLGLDFHHHHGDLSDNEKKEL